MDPITRFVIERNVTTRGDIGRGRVESQLPGVGRVERIDVIDREERARPVVSRSCLVDHQLNI